MLSLPQKPCLIVTAVTSLFILILITSSLTGNLTPLCSSVTAPPVTTSHLTSTILHYATSSITPQQSRSEIRISYNVLRARAPCNFLVFGLGHDSLMWQAFNEGGTTVFLEEDNEWFQKVTKDAPELRAFHVKYPTQLKEADQLMATWRKEPACDPAKASLKGNKQCKLALSGLNDEIYEKEWDLIMVDAPKGYFPEAPGRMGAIYSAALMARNRKGAGPTHVFLHDVDRKVEKTFAMEFLCKKYLVEGTGRLWHFVIPAVGSANATESSGGGFC